jgi:UDP-N-acetylglucosamine 2-epimerase (hydrolysing)
VAAARASRVDPDNGFGMPGAQERILALLEGEQLWKPSLYKEFVDR